MPTAELHGTGTIPFAAQKLASIRSNRVSIYIFFNNAKKYAIFSGKRVYIQFSQGVSLGTYNQSILDFYTVFDRKKCGHCQSVNILFNSTQKDTLLITYAQY